MCPTLSYKFLFPFLSVPSLSSESLSVGDTDDFGHSSSWRYVFMIWEKVIALNTQTTGVKVNINLTITPAKYTAVIAYKITEMKNTSKLHNNQHIVCNF